MKVIVAYMDEQFSKSISYTFNHITDVLSLKPQLFSKNSIER